MSNIPLYMDFLEGRLDGDSEQRFAEEFLYSEPFRKGFRNFVAVTGAISSNISKFGPPSSVTAAVFTSAGYGSGITAQAQLTSTAVKTSFFNGQLFTGIISSVLSVAVSVAFMYFAYIDEANQTPPISNSAAGSLAVLSSEMPVVSVNGSSGQAAQSKLESSDNQKQLVTQKSNSESESNKVAANDLSGPKPASSLIDRDLKENNGPYGTDKKYEPIDISMSDPVIIIQDNNNKTDVMNYPGMNNELIKGLDYNANTRNSFEWMKGFQIEVRKTTGTSFVKETVEPKISGVLNNSGISLIYGLTDEISFGLDIRQEDFFVYYESTDSLNRKFNIEQQANLTLFGIFARYYPDISILGIKPNLQLLAGGEHYGLTLRAGAGLQYNILSDVSIVLQAEYTQLFFMHDGEYPNVGKIGLNYGINYKF